MPTLTLNDREFNAVRSLVRNAIESAHGGLRSTPTPTRRMPMFDYEDMELESRLFPWLDDPSEEPEDCEWNHEEDE